MSSIHYTHVLLSDTRVICQQWRRFNQGIKHICLYVTAKWKQKAWVIWRKPHRTRAMFWHFTLSKIPPPQFSLSPKEDLWPPSNTMLLRPSRVSIPNRTSIPSAVFAGRRRDRDYWQTSSLSHPRYRIIGRNSPIPCIRCGLIKHSRPVLLQTAIPSFPKCAKLLTPQSLGSSLSQMTPRLPVHWMTNVRIDLVSSLDRYPHHSVTMTAALLFIIMRPPPL